MLIQGFDVFGIHMQYWMLISALIVVAAIVNGVRKRRRSRQLGHSRIQIRTPGPNSGPTRVLVVMRTPAATMLACLTKPNPGQNSFGAKIAQDAAMRRASNSASPQRRAYNRKSFSFSSEAFEAITHRHQKEAQPEGQRASALVTGRDRCAFRERRLRWSKSNKRLAAANCKVSCTYVFKMGVATTL
jgi:hypothetical protein